MELGSLPRPHDTNPITAIQKAMFRIGPPLQRPLHAPDWRIVRERAEWRQGDDRARSVEFVAIIMTRSCHLYVVAFTLAAAAAAAAQDVPQLTVGRLADGEGPTIDGRVEETEW